MWSKPGLQWRVQLHHISSSQEIRGKFARERVASASIQYQESERHEGMCAKLQEHELPTREMTIWWRRRKRGLLKQERGGRV